MVLWQGAEKGTTALSKFWTVRKFLKNHLTIQKCSPKIAKFEAENPKLEKFKGKIEISVTHNFCSKSAAVC